jgi:beta-glucosidase
LQKLSAEFPFLWGAATSSHQVEGYNEKNDWAAFEAQGRVEGGARSGPATDHWNRFREDIRLAADIGLNSYRFSVEWSRIEPEQGRFDPAAIEWYSELIAECEKHRIVPMLTLHHFTSPQWFAEAGGFTWAQAAERFRDYTRHIARELGPRVPLWCTINEPMVLVAGTYLGKFMPPAVFSPQLAALACHQLLKSHAYAYDILHSEIPNRVGPWKDRPIEVGIAQNVLDFMPDRYWHPMELLLSRVFHGFYNRSWLDAVVGKKPAFGVIGLVPNAEPVKEALGRKTCDFIGINYYTKAYVQWRPRGAAEERPGDLPIGLSFARRKEAASDVGWAIHPEGFGKMLKLAGTYGLPVYITENGIADREDSMRPEYLLSHLKEVARAIENGVDVRGYYHWALLDNFEWIKGFGPRFGLYRVNYETFERTPTQTVELYRKIIAAHPSGEGRRPDLTYFKNF